MNRRWCTLPLSILGLWGLIPWATPASAQAIPTDDEILAIIQERVETVRAHGIVVGVREADGTHRVVFYGEAGVGAAPLGPESVFEIGSVTKVFTGILLAEMSGRGEVSLEDPVQKYLPSGVAMPSPRRRRTSS